MRDCLFCRIIAGTAAARKLFEDDDLVVIGDIRPQAPLHALVIPRRHISTLNDLGPEDDDLIGRMIRRAASIAGEQGYAQQGYRALFNCNSEAGQTVYHIHLHVLGGRRFGWPPG
jgi:histidine triad (HIT) family protein